MGPTSSELVRRSRIVRLSLLAAPLLTPPTAARAQTVDDRPAVSALLGIGAASAPDFETPVPGAMAPAVLASIGLRVRAPHYLFVDGATQAQFAFVHRDALTVPGAPPDVVSRRWDSKANGRTFAASSELRVGAEAGMARGPSVRAALGGGYLWGLSVPFVSGMAGIGAGSRAMRLTADVEYRKFRLPVQDVEYDFSSGMYRELVIGGRGYEDSRTVLLRVGVEVAVAR